jgi:serine/threonine protein kinase/tetratricopeptide (TPR) repeat protein
MSSPRWQQLEEIFQTALDLKPADRAAYLARACKGDADLQREVKALLGQFEKAGDLLEKPLYAESGIHDLASQLENEADPMIGQRIGAYRIDREIGRGGMGTVYLAERADEVFRRRVAIKVIKRGMDTDFVLRRFRHERRILAELDHPNIARLLDGGTTESGLPYFVMEFIEGQPLYKYCDSLRLNVRQRLRLFCQVCDAVDYAHQRQIIHRDIKPNNILVTTSGVPKLIDFGIAKLFNPEVMADTAPVTAPFMPMMTMEYASPEQVEGQPVSRRSDVYSLGVVLYELLTGHRPYRFGNRSPYEMARLISEEQPESPSDAVSRTDNLLPSTHGDGEAITIGHLCETRQQTPEGLRRELAGSLDSIVLHALRKDPEERYQSAAALREAIDGYLEGHAVPIHEVVTPLKPLVNYEKRTADTGERSGTSVAVLPFKLFGTRVSNDTDEYLGVGLADALITRLSNVRRLMVRPTSSVLKYGETGDPFDAGRKLAVNYIVDGNIRRAGDTFRVTVQLLNVDEQAARWAGKFDEKTVDVLRLEDLISEQVTGALIPHLTSEEQQLLAKRGTDNPKAYAAYLRGRFFWNRFTAESLPRAIEGFQTAIALDPDYALAHVGIADFYNWAAIYGILPAAPAYERARAAAMRALELDENLGEAHAALGLTIESADWDYPEVERLYIRALELNPSYSLAHEWYSSLLVGTGRFAEGLNRVRRAEELDPLSLRAMTLSSWTAYQAREFAEALEKANRIVAIDRTYPLGFFERGISLVQLGRADEGVIDLRQVAAMMPESALPKYELCFALTAANRFAEAVQVKSEIESLAKRTYVMPYFLAMSHVAVGDKQNALHWFEKVFTERDPWLIWFGTDPKLDQIRTEPRLRELFRATGNPLAFR